MNKPVALMRKTDITEFCEYNLEMAESDNLNAFAKWSPLYSQDYVSALENDLNILSKEWVQVAMALGKATKEIHEKQAEIDSLKIQIDKGVLDSYSYVLGFTDGKKSLGKCPNCATKHLWTEKCPIGKAQEK